MYYDVKGYVEGQMELLAREQSTLTKAMRIGTDSESKTTSTANWQRELALFLQADINKPAYRLSYLIARPDSLTYEYTLQPGEDLPVRYLRVELDKSQGQPVYIEAKLLTENKLYQSEKQILLRSGEVAGKWQVQSYQVKGYQELAMTDRKPFEITAKIN